jgi:hypothetical protein
MILFPQTQPDGTKIDAPSCATCKWAEAPRGVPGEIGYDYLDSTLALAGFPLRCQLAEQEGGSPVHNGRMCVTMDGSDYRGDLYVQPNFGCVQWEGKE